MQHPLRRNLCLLYFIMLSKIWCEWAAHMASKIKPEGLCCKMAVIKFNRPGKIKGFSAKITSYCMHDWLFRHLHFFAPWACNLTMIKLLIFCWFFFLLLSIKICHSHFNWPMLLTFLSLALRPRDTAEENASWRKPSTGHKHFLSLVVPKASCLLLFPSCCNITF